MKILDVQPKDIHVTLEFSLNEIDLILEYLDHVKVAYVKEAEPKMAQADDLIKSMFSTLNNLHKDLTEGKSGI